MSTTFHPAVPIFRIFDVAKARDFYIDYVGFSSDWEHRFSEEAPLYMQISRGALKLHLSEHHGDATPGSTAYVEINGVRDLHAELQAKHYPFLNPGLEDSEIGTVLELLDPFGNRLRLNEPHG